MNQYCDSPFFPETNICEVVDKTNHVLCLMPRRDVLAQKLLHRALGVIFLAPEGKILLHRSQGDSFCIPCFEIQPAGRSARDFGGEVLKRQWNLPDCSLCRLGQIPPLPQTAHAFTTMFGAKISGAHARELARQFQNNVLADRVELAALSRDGDILSPLVLYLYERTNFLFPARK